MASDQVLITGSTGFTGSHLAARLAVSHAGIRLFVRTKPTNPIPSAEYVIGDLRDQGACLAATHGIDTIYHIAAAYRGSGLTAEQCDMVNHRGVVHLFRGAEKNAVRRFVHCSTVGVHGEIKGAPANEEAPFDPGDAYQESKVSAERFLRSARAGSSMELVIFRPTGIYGPGDLRLLKFIRMLARGRFFMIGDGSPRYHLTYIDDLVDGILLCGTKEGIGGETFILGGPEAPTLNEWARIVANELGVSPPRFRVPVAPFMVAAMVAETICPRLGLKPPIFRRRMDFFTKNRAFDIGKARRVLGFAPSIGVTEGMSRTISWYREQNLI